LIAITWALRWAKRTVCLDRPLGRAAMFSAGHCSNGKCHGKSSKAGSTVAAVISNAWDIELVQALSGYNIEQVHDATLRL
jgi:hypothetical protein